MAKDILYPLRRLHGWFHDYPEYCRERNALRVPYIQKIKEYQKNNMPFVFLVMTPEHGNLGDHAIAFAETELLKRAGISFVEITGKQLYRLKSYKLLGIMNKYSVLMQGGGYLGTLWFSSEETLREILSKNQKSRIIMLPNTIFYEENGWGKEELKKSIDIYNAHKNLTIYAREKISYDFMTPIYRDVRLMPDMVMSLKPEIPNIDRHGCLLCLRGDCERTRTEEQEQKIHDQAAKLFGSDVTVTDMMVEGGIPVEQRETALQKKFMEFSGAELVITDRLHGMVFCAITGTPCVVVDSKSPKVRGCYEWIKHLDYIRFAGSSEDIVVQYQQIPPGPHHYDNSHLTHYYESLAKDIKNIWR